ncbi:interferon regulatory factor 2-like isoform X1 [Kryptolebias marmoratus]|uniref:Interferon regulatory factor 2-like n=1 Tax=Kryptolebias marmoratus TaxID=37003 RepID=A0A3Q3B7P1_KRYMA|nr:interferon regulatory factor 2-like isoform X1 [Kryptolebias marmoratus]
MQQPGRQRLRSWLEEQIQSGKYPGVSWLDQTAQIFQIPWKHAARHGWSIDRDATLFRSWAMHTGRYRPGKDKPDPKTWKANFRCALNSLPDICELREHSRKRGSNAYRVYRMLPSSQKSRRRRGLQLFSSPQEKQTGLQEGRNDDIYTRHTWQPTSQQISDAHCKMETSVQHTFNNTETHGMWESKPEEQEHNEAVYKLIDHLSGADLWSQTWEQRGWRTHTVWDPSHCAVDENQYSLHTESYGELFGPNCIKDLSDWSTHQQPLIP